MNVQNIRSSFLKYTLLNVISSLGISFYILADTYFISKGLGADGLAALNLALPVFNFINGFGLMLGIGGATKFSIIYCRTERIETDRIYTNTVMGMLCVAAAFELLGLFFSRPLTYILGADESVFELTNQYLRLVLLFSPAFLMNNVMVCFMRNDSAPKLAMAGMLIGSAANIFLDYYFIFIRHMGMFGAALATCTAPFISMGVMSIHVITGWSAFRFRFLKPSKKLIKSIVNIGVSSFISEVAAGVVIIAFNFLILRLKGNTGIAAYGVVANIAIVTTSIYTGISYGVQPLMSKYHGGHDNDALKYLLKSAILMVLLFSAIIYLAIFYYDTELTAIFNSENNPELQKMSETGLKLYFTAIPFMGFNIINSVFFTSTEKPLPAQIMSVMRGIALVIPIAFIFSKIWGINGIWLTVPAAELITAVFGIIIYFVRSKPELNAQPSLKNIYQ